MDISAVFALIGSVALLTGLLGGGIEAKEIKIPVLPRWSRFLVSLLGIIMISIAIWLTYPNLTTKSSSSTPSGKQQNELVTPNMTLTPDLIPTQVLSIGVSSISDCKVVINGLVKSTTKPLVFSWGDGSSHEGLFPQEHTYLLSGSYTLIVMTAEGLSGSTTFTVNCNGPAPTPTSNTGFPIFTPDSNKTYRIRSVISGLYLGSSRDPSDTEKKIFQSELSDNINQKWQFVKISQENSDYYFIQSVDSKKCFDVSAGSLDDGAEIIEYQCTGNDNQKWRLYQTSSGIILIQVNHSQKMLDMGYETSNTPVQQWVLDGSPNQNWLLVEVP